jgi:hypothetical protein
VLAAERAGISVRGVKVVSPTLDEVFLELTGHAYREEGDPANGGGGSPSVGGAA